MTARFARGPGLEPAEHAGIIKSPETTPSPQSPLVALRPRSA